MGEGCAVLPGEASRVGGSVGLRAAGSVGAARGLKGVPILVGRREPGCQIPNPAPSVAVVKALCLSALICGRMAYT